MGILPLEKRVNRNKCSFATKQRMFRVFAIDEILRYRGTRFPGSRTLCHPVQEYILCRLVNKSPTRSIECSYSQDLSALNKAVRVLMWSYLRCNSQTTDNSISTNNSFRMVVTQLSFFVFTFLYKSTKVWPIFYQVPRPTC